MKLHARKNWWWLWVWPAALSGLLVFLAKPAGGAAFWVEMALIGLCSCFFGFALAIKDFSTVKERFWAGLFFSGASLGLFSNVLFLGCICGPQMAPTATLPQKLQWETWVKASVAPQIVPRDPQADSTMLDLTPLYDGLLPGQLAPGTHAWAGIKFDVRGRVNVVNQPGGRITGIPVRQNCSEIAFLYRADQQFRPFALSCRVVVHFANGHNETISTRVNRQDLNSTMTNSAVWEERISADGTSRPLVSFRITKWKNPFPMNPVTSVDFIPSAGDSGAFLIAITVLPVKP